MRPAIIKYNAGNIQSVLFALERIGVEGIVTDDAKLIASADKVIFPGVGEASTAMKYLHERGLAGLIPSLQQPVLGICLGMQLMCAYSEENTTKCLDIFKGVLVKRFVPGSKIEKVPQVGWNNIYDLNGPLFPGVGNEPYCYFVHSYYAELSSYQRDKKFFKICSPVLALFSG